MNEIFKNFYLTEIGGIFQVYSPLGVHREIVDRKYSGILVCTSGEIYYKHKGEVFRCDKDHVLFVPANISYCLDCVKEDISYVINFKCTAYSPTFESFEVDVKPIVEYINNFRAHDYEADTNYKVILSRLILDLILKMTNGEKTHFPLILSEAIDYINNHYSDVGISNEEIAKHCSASIIYLQKLFAKYLNVGIKEYIMNLRFRKAEQLLISSAKPIYEISNDCGFSNQITFFRAFVKKHDGVTPLSYRKSNSVI